MAFLEKKHNNNTVQKDFPIEIYIGGPLYEPYFIAFTLKRKVIIGSTKKLVTSYIIRDLALLD